MSGAESASPSVSVFARDAFASQVIIVTGGGTGIGRKISIDLAGFGAEVVVVGRRMDRLEETVATIEAAGGKASAVSLNIRDADAGERAVNEIVARYDTVHGLVNNAGGQYAAPGEDITPNGWRSVIDLNLTGTFLMTRAVFRAGMHRTGGAIVNIVADMWNGFPMMCHSGAARAGVVNMTKTLAVEWGKARVRVNAVAPGLVETPGLDTYEPEARKAYLAASRSIPAGRPARMEDVSTAVCFLLSSAACYITGETLRVDGGSSLVAPWAQSVDAS